MSGPWFGQRFRDKGMSYIISMTCVQQWWFRNFMQNWSCMHLCGHSSIKFCGHATLRLRIHFSYLSQPSVSNTCSFINSHIHPNLFRGLEKNAQHPPFISFFFFFVSKRVGFSVNQFYFFFLAIFVFMTKEWKQTCTLDIVDICDHTFFEKSCEWGYARPTYVKSQRQSNRKNAMISHNEKQWQNKLRAIMSDHSGSKHNNWKQQR